MGVWLQISEAGETFADYVNLDSYFRRQAARSVGFSPNTVEAHSRCYGPRFWFLTGGTQAVGRWRAYS
jgi:hypothetical protein